MTSIFSKITELLEADDIDGAREKAAKISLDLGKINKNILDFATLLALGEQNALEIGLGVLGRKLLNYGTEVNDEIIWLFLASVLSRPNITPTSPSRISILGLISHVSSWELPIFALLSPALDTFLTVSIAEGNVLAAEQTLDFIATWGEDYAKAPHSKKQVREMGIHIQTVLNNVDDEELKDEWSQGVTAFLDIAENIEFQDANIWSASRNLLKKIYSPKVLQHDEEKKYNLVKDKISRLITSSLAAVKAILEEEQGLSIAVHIDNLKENNSWAIGASVIDRLERLFQEIADTEGITKLPAFTAPQAIPGSWTLILQVNTSPKQSKLLEAAIASISRIEEYEGDSSLVNSWQYFAEKIREDGLYINIALATSDTTKSQFINSLSTDDFINNEEVYEPKTRYRVLSYDIPQANNLEQVINFASLLVRYSSLSNVRERFAEINGVTDRHFAYYRRAVQILGLADERVRPTITCHALNRLQTQEAKIKFLAYQFMSSKIGSTWINWQDVNDISQIDIHSALDFLREVCPSLAQSTVHRRAQTLQYWVKMFKRYYDTP